MDKRVGLLGAVTLSMALALPASAEILKQLDVRQGFFFQAGAQAPVGCIRTMKLGTAVLEADIDTALPTTPNVSVKCVAVMSELSWGGGATDPIAVAGRVSAKNKQALAALVAHGKPLDVVFQYAVYEYDPVAKRYFLGAGSGGVDLKATTEPSHLAVDAIASTDVSAPQNHVFSATMKPKPVPQAIRLGTATGRTLAKPWGLQK